jgi:hypothetical protein
VPGYGSDEPEHVTHSCMALKCSVGRYLSISVITLAVAQDGLLQRVTIPEAACVFPSRCHNA